MGKSVHLEHELAALTPGASVRAATRKLRAAKWVVVPMGAAGANGQHCPITTEGRGQP
jgi:hypothetical protein